MNLEVSVEVEGYTNGCHISNTKSSVLVDFDEDRMCVTEKGIAQIVESQIWQADDFKRAVFYAFHPEFGKIAFVKYWRNNRYLECETWNVNSGKTAYCLLSSKEELMEKLGKGE